MELPTIRLPGPYRWRSCRRCSPLNLKRNKRCRRHLPVIYFVGVNYQSGAETAAQNTMRLRSIGVPLAIAGLWSLFLSQAAALGVCADPDYLPYSNRAGEGFENKIAAAVAKALGEKVEYTWASSRGHGGFPQFLSSTLDAKKCAVIMNIPYGSREELTTRPYYISSYVFVFGKTKHYQIASMDSPALKQVKVGFERDTPAEQGVKLRGMLPRSVAFDVGEEDGKSPATMLEALKKGEIDVLITWQPAIGSFLRAYPNIETV